MKDTVSIEPLAGPNGSPLGVVQVRTGFIYNIPLEELVENAREADVVPLDMFDWFHLLPREAGAEAWDWVWNWECA